LQPKTSFLLGEAQYPPHLLNIWLLLVAVAVAVGLLLLLAAVVVLVRLEQRQGLPYLLGLPLLLLLALVVLAHPLLLKPKGQTATILFFRQ
jgi:hypothetical protein